MLAHGGQGAGGGWDQYGYPVQMHPTQGQPQQQGMQQQQQPAQEAGSLSQAYQHPPGGYGGYHHGQQHLQGYYHGQQQPGAQGQHFVVAPPPPQPQMQPGPSGLSQTQLSMLHQQQRQQPPPYPTQQQQQLHFDLATNPSASSSPSFPHAYPSGQPQSAPSHPQLAQGGGGAPGYGISYGVPPDPIGASSSSSAAPMAMLSATAQRFHSTPSSSPAPPFQPQSHALPPQPPQQHLSHAPPPPPNLAQPPQQQRPPPPPTADALQHHLARVDEVKALQVDIRQLEGFLQRGTYPDGPRAGHPLAADQRAHMERQVRELKNRELAVINDCEGFIRAHGGSGNVHHYVERFRVSQQAQAQAQAQAQQQAAMYGQQPVQRGPAPPRPASAASFQQVEMVPPQPQAQGHLHQRVASYGQPPPPPGPAPAYGQPAGYPVYQQQQSHPPPPQQQQQQQDFSSPRHVHMLPPQPLPPSHPQPLPPGPPNPQSISALDGHPQYHPHPAASSAPGRFLPPHPSQQARPPSVNAGGMMPSGVPGYLDPSQGQQGQGLMRPPAPVQQRGAGQPSPHPHHALPPQQQAPPPHSHPQQQQPPSSSAPNPNLPHPAGQPSSSSSSSSSAFTFSPDLPPGLRAQMAAAAREQAQRALTASRAKMTQQAVRPAATGDMPVLTLGGFKTKEEWERMEEERKGAEERKMKSEEERRERAKTVPSVVLAEQKGGVWQPLREFVNEMQPPLFYEQLKLVLAKRGQSLAPQGYVVEGKQVDLFQLWKIVVGQHGGYFKVDGARSWPSIAATLSLPAVSTSRAPALVKELYHRTLAAYEDHWATGLLKQREKDAVLQDAKRMLEGRGSAGVGGAGPGAGGGGDGTLALVPQMPSPGSSTYHAAPAAAASAAFVNGGQVPLAPTPAGQQHQSMQPGTPFSLAPSPATHPHPTPTSTFSLPPSSASPAAFTLPTPAPSGPTSSSPALTFASVPPGLGTPNFPLTSAPSPHHAASSIPVTTPPGSSSMFASATPASGFLPFPPTPATASMALSGAQQAGLPPSSGGGGGGGGGGAAGADLQVDVEPELSLEELLAQAAEVKADRLDFEASSSKKHDSPSAGISVSTPQGSSQLAPSPTAVAAAAAGQVAPFSLPVSASAPGSAAGTPTPSVTLSRANSMHAPSSAVTAAAAAVSTPPNAASPSASAAGSLAPGGTPRSEALSRAVSGSSRKREREKSRETELSGVFTSSSGAGKAGSADGSADGGEARVLVEDEEDEGRKREGSNPFQASPLASAKGVASQPGSAAPTPDLVPSKSLRPDTSSTTTTGGSPSPLSIINDLPSTASTNPSSAASSTFLPHTSSSSSGAVHTPAASLPTPGSAAATLSTPSAQLAASAGGLTISTPPVPTYSHTGPRAVELDPFAALNDLNNSPSLGFGGAGSDWHLDDQLGHLGALGSGGGGGGGGAHGSSSLNLDFGDFGSDFPLPDGFDFLNPSSTAADLSTGQPQQKSSADHGTAGDDWASGLLDFDFAADPFAPS